MTTLLLACTHSPEEIDDWFEVGAGALVVVVVGAAVGGGRVVAVVDVVVVDATLAARVVVESCGGSLDPPEESHADSANTNSKDATRPARRTFTAER